MLSLGWLLEEVSRQMTQIGKSSNYIVDIMPNLRFLIKNESFLAECSKEMKAFEQKVTQQFIYIEKKKILILLFLALSGLVGGSLFIVHKSFSCFCTYIFKTQIIFWSNQHLHRYLNYLIYIAN